MLYCPNYSCQTPNPETHRFCQKCRTPLPRHYLWAVGNSLSATQPGELLQNRFLCKAPNIFLDTKPGLVPATAIEVPAAFTSYLRLTPHQLHIPQVYEVLDATAILLEEAALFVSPSGTEVQILPALSEVWAQASPLRQLNWLWQIAALWQPLASEQTATSLLLPELLRVEGGIVRLLELVPPQAEAPTLAQLGQQWTKLVPEAHPAIAPFLDHLCQQLETDLRSSEPLVEMLDQALTTLGQGQQRQIHIATRTDQGPTRQRNEDACFPASGTLKTLTISSNQTAADPALAIVCDGIGGHQGGDVASNLAIATLGQQLQGIHAEQLNPSGLTAALEAAVWAANDAISQRNDSEQRLDRQRMGTTLVMSLVRGHELYTTHVGDSRAYRITRWGCRQVTLDDDIASREVRLGYSTYREALQHPGSGSLIQALGMGASQSLHPTVQRFVLDEDCVFLLCSDGLSDNDRVQELWDAEILPLLDGKADLGTACERLIALANTRNGHDNVTVALLHAQVGDRGSVPSLSLPTAEPVAATVPVVPSASPPTHVPPVATAPNSTLKTQVIKSRSARPSLLPLLLSILILLGIGGAIAYLLFPGLGRRVAPDRSDRPSPSSTASSSVSPSPTASALPLQIGSYLTIATDTDPLRLLPQPDASAPSDAARLLPVGTRLQVLSRQSSTTRSRWVQVRVCSLPDSPSIAAPTSGNTTPPGSPRPSPIPKPNFKLGDTGWLEEAAAAPLVVNRSLPPAQQGACRPVAAASPASEPSATPTPQP